ncbi:MAG: HPF/RaiA family ribosome-associated protein [Sphingobacteriales bacterium]|nr:MAG: HPF/RaiA family ribosome-associated protein [Sphingobacteriales bacterium]
MDVVIQSLGFKASPDLENYIHDKLGKLDNMSDTIVRANVTLFGGPDSKPEHNHCEIRLEVPGNDHFVKKSAESFEQAVVSAVNTLQGMIRKVKEKQSDKRP